MPEIVIYRTEDNTTELEVQLDGETVWLSQQQMAALFRQTKQNISLHINNCFKEGELPKKATVKESLTVQKEGNRQVKRKLEYYNLDVIISVGYRVKSKQGTRFRQWATQRLKDYLVKGYALNERRLRDAEGQLENLKQTVNLIGKVAGSTKLSTEETQGLIKVLEDYTVALDILDKYDHQQLKIGTSKAKEVFRISYAEARKAIEGLKDKFGGSHLFGREKDQSFKSSLSAIYQTFDGRDVYSSVEEKAAHLLYFVVKNHSFTDGNKRIAAFLFVWFMERNQLLYHNHQKLIDDNALVALTLMIAESAPADKEMMIKVIVNLMRNKK